VPTSAAGDPASDPGGDSASRLDAQWSTAYTAYLLVAWNRLHHLYDEPSQVFRAPYDRTLPPVFDSEHPGQQVLAAIPPTLSDLLTPYGKDLLRHPTGAFARALQEADDLCRSWTPRVPVRLHVSQQDEQAAPGSTRSCATQLRARGAQVRVVDLSPAGHLETNAAAVPEIARWFQDLARDHGGSPHESH